MGFFDRVEKEEFDTFKAEVAVTLVELRDEIRRSASDSEELARIAADAAEESQQRAKIAENSTEAVLHELGGYRDETYREIEALRAERKKNATEHQGLIEQFELANRLNLEVAKKKEEVDAASADIIARIAVLEEFLQKSATLPDAVAKAHFNLEESAKATDNINALLSQSAARKGRIDELHKEIYGVDVVGDDGKTVHSDGLRDLLDQSYKSTVSELDSLGANVTAAIDKVQNDHSRVLSEQRDSFEDLLIKSTAKIEAIETQLKSLLPGSLAAGLSAAYEEKKTEEIQALHRFEKTFRNAIIGMACVSLIPFATDAYLIYFKGRELIEVIKDTPALVAAILPLYFPILWLAYSTNKQYKLSKRLIEEYTHKSVLGKTFSGLSNQIDSLPSEGSVREDLRNRLLFSVLQVSAENPGKLITDYSKSDHPLMDALENSAKLADSIHHLAKIPGFAALAKKLSEKSESILKTQHEKVKDGLLAQETLEENVE